MVGSLDDLTDEEQAEYRWSRMRVLDARNPAYDGPECPHCGSCLSFDEAVHGGGICEDCSHAIAQEDHTSLEESAR